jgi:hypothetical protein
VERIGGRDSATTYTYTLTAGEELPERTVRTLFDRPGTQSVAWYPDAKRIVASGFGRPLGRSQPSFRPSLAFDGDGSTAWRASTLEEGGAGQWVRVDLREPQTVSEISILPAPTFPNQPQARHATISFSDGSTVPVDLDFEQGATVARFEPRDTTFVRVDIDDVAPSFGIVSPGLAEISIPGLDLREHIQLPTGVLDRAERNPKLGAALADASLSYLFRVQAPDEQRVVEPSLARRFETIDTRTYTLTGELDPGSKARVARCQRGLLKIDGVDARVRKGDDDTLVGCDPIELGPGWHTLTTTNDLKVAQAQLVSGTIARSAPPGAVVQSDVARTSASARVKTRAPAAVIVAQSFDPTWKAKVDGDDLGPVIELDTLSGWTVDRTGTYSFDAQVGAQRTYVVALVISLLAVVVCGWLVLRRRRGPPA